MTRRFFCHFCFRPSTGTCSWSTHRASREVSHCDRHLEDAGALAFGWTHIVTSRLERARLDDAEKAHGTGGGA
jgi:hypothetical protein